MIEQLTPEQEAKLPEYRDKWIAIGLATQDKPIDRPKVEALFAKLYELSEKTVPTVFHYVDSPRAGRRLVREDYGVTDSSSLGYGNHDANWLSFYQFFQDELGIELDPRLQVLIELAYQIGWYWTLDDAVVISNRPTEVHMRNEVLHRDGGPAIRYDDGLEVYAMNGVRFTGDDIGFVTAYPGDIDAKAALNIKNVEQRAEVIKKIGIDKLFYQLEPTLLDKQGEYELYSVLVYEDSPRIYLKMANPSVAEIHIEAVHPDCATVDAALQWRNFGTIDVGGGFNTPMILT